MKLYRHKLLSDAQLRKLSEHRYSCASNSILDSLLQGYWNWLVSKVPLWLAPNLITIVGLIINVVTTLILVWHSPDAKQEAPCWACGLCALGLFVYQSLDAIDGKQARRTGCANPLGELFDHGCDSISTVFVALSACTAVQLGYYPGWMFFQCFCAMSLFYCAHWQTYVSGTLRFGKIDVTEAQFTIMIIQMVSAIFGPTVWSTKFFSDTFTLWYIIPILTFICGLWSLQKMLIVIFTGGVGKNGSTVAVFGLPISKYMCTIIFAGFANNFIAFLGSIKAGGCGKNGSTVAIPGLELEVKQVPMAIACLIAIILAQANLAVIFTGGVGKNGSTVAGTSVLSPIIPFSAVLVPAFIIYRKSVENIYELHPALYILAFGMVAAKVTNRLVVAHMTKSEMDYMDWSLLGPTMLFLNQYFNTFIPEYYVLWLCMIWVAVDLFRYSYQICSEICDHLRIELFRIPYPSGSQRYAPPRIVPPQATQTEKNGTSYFIQDIQDKDDVLPLLESNSEIKIP